MSSLAHSVAEVRPVPRVGTRTLLAVVLAIFLPVGAGLAWHYISDNPAWPFMRSSMNLCSMTEATLAPVSADGLYRVHVVQAVWLGRFAETLVFVSPADEPWPLAAADPNRSVLEVAGLRSLDAITWQASQDGNPPVLQLWFAPGAATTQIHRLERSWRGVTIATLTSQPAPGAERLDY